MIEAVSNLDAVPGRTTNQKYKLTCPFWSKSFLPLISVPGFCEKTSLTGAFFYSAFLCIAPAGRPKKITCAAVEELTSGLAPGPNDKRARRRTFRQLMETRPRQVSARLISSVDKRQGIVENILRRDKRSQSPTGCRPCLLAGLSGTAGLFTVLLNHQEERGGVDYAKIKREGKMKTAIAILAVSMLMSSCAVLNTPMINRETGDIKKCEAFGFGWLGVPMAFAAQENCKEQMRTAGYEVAE